MAKTFLDVSHPWLKPLWRRALLTGAVLAWTAFEFSRGAVFWGILFGAAGLWLAYKYFIAFDPKDYERSDPDAAPPPPSDGN
jgi:hypothetical protein